MITGRGSGSGKYSYHETSNLGQSVMVSHMPDDGHTIRIVFKHHGENSLPIIKLGIADAELLWASLNRMAADMKWEDKLVTEKSKEAESK